MRFKQYLKKCIGNYRPPEVDFAYDVLHDRSFPLRYGSQQEYHDRIYKYLRECGACREAIEAFENIWRDYVSKF